MVETYERKIAVDKYPLLRDVPNSVMNEYARVIKEYSKEGDNILDLGFGTGLILIPLSKISEKRNIFGIDISEEMCKKIGLMNISAKIIKGTIDNLEEVMDIIHFKAILHCISEPEKELEKISAHLKVGGYIITGHEFSQTEDRIEQIFKDLDDSEIEEVFKKYFSIRKEMGKAFVERKFPAGDASKISELLINKNNFEFVKKISKPTLFWERKITIKDLLDSINDGTFGVFYDGLKIKEREEIYNKLISYTKEKGIDINKERIMPCRMEIFVLKKIK
jgi:ubiquinone/menaquinone biosynthesis C-methylase UbiE